MSKVNQKNQLKKSMNYQFQSIFTEVLPTPEEQLKNLSLTHSVEKIYHSPNFKINQQIKRNRLTKKQSFSIDGWQNMNRKEDKINYIQAKSPHNFYSSKNVFRANRSKQNCKSSIQNPQKLNKSYRSLEIKRQKQTDRYLNTTNFKVGMYFKRVKSPAKREQLKRQKKKLQPQVRFPEKKINMVAFYQKERQKMKKMVYQLNSSPHKNVSIFEYPIMESSNKHRVLSKKKRLLNFYEQLMH